MEATRVEAAHRSPDATVWLALGAGLLQWDGTAESLHRRPGLAAVGVAAIAVLLIGRAFFPPLKTAP